MGCRPSIVDVLVALVPACAVCMLGDFEDWGMLCWDPQQWREGPLVLEAQNMLGMREQWAEFVDRGMSGADVLELTAWQKRSPTMHLSVLQELCGRVEGSQSEVDW